MSDGKISFNFLYVVSGDINPYATSKSRATVDFAFRTLFVVFVVVY